MIMPDLPFLSSSQPAVSAQLDEVGARHGKAARYRIGGGPPSASMEARYATFESIDHNQVFQIHGAM
jgi:hypothetical protein